MKLLKIETYTRRAYRRRYGFQRVTIGATGAITGHWPRGTCTGKPMRLGHIDDCSTTTTETGVRFYNRHNLVYTFALPNA